jgi:hypothetical protein
MYSTTHNIDRFTTSAVDSIMSKKVDAHFLYEKDKECKCPPQHCPRSNLNEAQASRRTSGSSFRDCPHEATKFSMESAQRKKWNLKIAEKDKSVAMKETVLFEEKEKGKDPTGNTAYSSNLYDLRARNKNKHDVLGPVADNGIGTKNRGTAGGRHVTSHSRGPDTSPGSEAFPRQAYNHHITEEKYPGAVRVAGLDSAEGYEEDERTITVGYEEQQATVANQEQSTVDIIAQVVDTEEENRRFRQQERIRLERDQFLRERNQLRRIMDNTVIVDPVVVTSKDVQNTIVAVNQGATNDGESLENSGHKCGTGGMRWFAIGVILLIVVALTVALAIVLPNRDDPTPTDLGPNLPEDEIPCDEMPDGSRVCHQQGYPADGYTLDFFCPDSASNTADCTACAIIASDSAAQCNSCTLCSSNTIPVAFDCSNVAEGDCVTSDCDGNCYDSPGSDQCLDVAGWYDADGPEFDCTWYAQDDNCELFGSGLENDGYTANEACCVCGGGSIDGEGGGGGGGNRTAVRALLLRKREK